MEYFFCSPVTNFLDLLADLVAPERDEENHTLTDLPLQEKNTTNTELTHIHTHSNHNFTLPALTLTS